MSEEFWTSDKGILIRMEDLAHDFSLRTYNGALKGAFREAGFKELMWVSVIDARTCNYCDSQNGRRYHTGMFLPRMPSHPSCRCMWDIFFRG